MLQECEVIDDVRTLKPMFKQRLAVNSKTLVITDIGLLCVSWSSCLLMLLSVMDADSEDTMNEVVFSRELVAASLDLRHFANV